MVGGNMLWIVALHLVLTALPGAAATLALARRGVRSVPLLLVVGLAATAVVAMLAFWLYFAAPLIGQTFSFFVAFGSAGLVAWRLWEREIDGALLLRLAVPLLLWVLGTYFLVYLGFLHGGEGNPLGTAATRFSVGLPSDNGIPIFFAEWFYHHGHQTPIPEFPGEWLSSDRPPLQVGYVLSQMPFYRALPGQHYEAIGVALQQLWIIGLWALLEAARVSRLTKGLAMITVLVSDVAIVNGFFVWPKMLPAAMLLAVAALVLTPLWDEVRKRTWGAVLVAALVGIAMMGHGGSVFAVIPLAIVGAWRGLPSWRWLGVGVLVGLCFMAPWSAYQKYVDPPGNRLLKYMLAGEPEVSATPTRESIFNAYSRVGLGGAIHEKAENYVTMFGGGPAYEALHRAVDDVREGNWSSFLDEVRVVYFFDLFPSLGLLLIVPIVMALARSRGRLRRTEWNFSLTLWSVVAIGAFFWGLIMFGDLAGRAVLHAGTFSLPVIAFVACVVGLRAVFPRFAIWYTAIAATLMFAVYVPVLRPPPETSYSWLAILIAAVTLGAFVFLTLWHEGAGDARLEPVGEEPLEVLGDPRGLAIERPGAQRADS
jgi:hypothetical protein